MRTFFRFALIVFGGCCGFSVAANAEDTDWPVYLGGKERNLYSSLQQIDRDP